YILHRDREIVSRRTRNMRSEGRSLCETPPDLLPPERLAAPARRTLGRIVTAVQCGAVPYLIERASLLRTHTGCRVGVGARYVISSSTRTKSVRVAKGVIVAGERIKQKAEARFIAGRDGFLGHGLYLCREGGRFAFLDRRKPEFGLCHELGIDRRRPEF